MRRGGFSVHAPSLHEHAGKTSRRAEQVSQAGSGVGSAGLSGKGLGQVGASTAGAHQRLVSRMQSSLGRSGERLRGQSDRLRQSADRFTAADEEHAGQLRSIHTRSGGPPTLPAGSGGGGHQSTSAGGRPIRPPRPHQTGAGRHHPYARPGGGGSGRPGGPSGGSSRPGGPSGGAGRPPAQQPPPPPPPQQPPPPPPPLRPGDPGWRPSNFKPDIPGDVHEHVAYGGWNDNTGKPTGGHMLHTDLPGPHPNPAGYAAGSSGHGSRPSAYGTHNMQPNGVYTAAYPEVRFDEQYGSGGWHSKQSDNHTYFPQGISYPGNQQMGHNAWNSPNARIWENGDGSGGGWTGPATIPPGYPGAGMPIKINGRYDGDGYVTTYHPAQYQ
ncbi:WXG100 family type VII secretion target [Kutzneria albida]|uniref:Bacterial EndoU nuclease domain-containing protein n=1 Tax=Kutzneria albida DSM 43870 TaxID=1449976 RepID=W5WFU7_9PSEU|nr:type VII secretion target [Kutzneria albida]AHH97049.1 hypothetical protein KALB_3685 [Kutzneria albida DSM 43870]